MIGYARVSTREQADEGGSLEAQRATIEAEAQRRGWTLLEVIEDAGVSGKSLRRPGIQRALELVGSGEADVLMAAKLDRLSRSVLDFAGLLQLAGRQGWSVIVVDMNVDTSTPAGEAMVTVMSAFAQMERRLIGQRTREGLAAKRAAGTLKGPIGRPPVLPAEVVDRIHREHAAGTSLRAIARALNADGVPTGHGGTEWRHSTLRKVLARPAV